MRITAALTLGLSMCCTAAAFAADRTFKPQDDGSIQFVLPSRNMGCTFIPKGGTDSYKPGDGGPELGCDRLEPSYVRLILSAAGKARFYQVEGDSGCCGSDNVLQYGDRWRAGPFRCSADQSGLKCSRDDGHGFFVSRKKYSLD